MSTSSPIPPPISPNPSTAPPYEVIFVGTGFSTAIPHLGHVLEGSIYKNEEEDPSSSSNPSPSPSSISSISLTSSVLDIHSSTPFSTKLKPIPVPCPVCYDAIHTKNSKNKRNNVSICIKINNEYNLLIDVGKTFRNACQNIFPKFNIKYINDIILTHGHADAIFGMDDLRDLQPIERIITKENDIGFRHEKDPIEIFLTQETFDVVQSVFPYITMHSEVRKYEENNQNHEEKILENNEKYINRVPKDNLPLSLQEYALKSPHKNNITLKKLSKLNFKLINLKQNLNFHSLNVQLFPVLHGSNYFSLGFSFNYGQFVYISDVKYLPEESFQYLKQIKEIEYIVIDCLDLCGIESHMNLNEGIQLIRSLKNVKHVLFVGVSCELGLHDDVNENLKKLGDSPTYELAYDGLSLKFP